MPASGIDSGQVTLAMALTRINGERRELPCDLGVAGEQMRSGAASEAIHDFGTTTLDQMPDHERAAARPAMPVKRVRIDVAARALE